MNKILASLTLFSADENGLHTAGALSGKAAIACTVILSWVGCNLQPGEPAPEGHSYIAASYVKFVEVRQSLAPALACNHLHSSA